MSEQLANLNTSPHKWKYYTEVTGTTQIALPSTFDELLVKTEYNKGAYVRTYLHHFIYEALPNNISTTTYYNIGFGQLLNNVSQNNWSSLWVGRDKVQLNGFFEANSDVTSLAKVTVYYK